MIRLKDYEEKRSTSHPKVNAIAIDHCGDFVLVTGNGEGYEGILEYDFDEAYYNQAEAHIHDCPIDEPSHTQQH